MTIKEAINVLRCMQIFDARDRDEDCEALIIAIRVLEDIRKIQADMSRFTQFVEAIERGDE